MEFIDYNEDIHKIIFNKQIKNEQYDKGSVLGTNFDYKTDINTIFIYITNMQIFGYRVEIKLYNEENNIFTLTFSYHGKYPQPCFYSLQVNDTVIQNTSLNDLLNKKNVSKCMIDTKTHKLLFYFEENSFLKEYDLPYDIKKINRVTINTFDSDMGSCDYTPLIFIDKSPQLMKSDNLFYNLHDDTYDIDRKVFSNIVRTEGQTYRDFFFNNKFIINDLFKEKNINGETFRPIDKFNNFKITKLI